MKTPQHTTKYRILDKEGYTVSTHKNLAIAKKKINRLINTLTKNGVGNPESIYCIKEIK
jgi:hypothetical protein